jgi:hypothetical protein
MLWQRALAYAAVFDRYLLRRRDNSFCCAVCVGLVGDELFDAHAWWRSLWGIVDQALFRAKPQRSIGGGDDLAGGSDMLGKDRLEVAISVADHATFRSHPQLSLGVDVQAADVVVGQTLFGGKGRKLAPVETT